MAASDSTTLVTAATSLESTSSSTTSASASTSSSTITSSTKPTSLIETLPPSETATTRTSESSASAFTTTTQLPTSPSSTQLKSGVPSATAGPDFAIIAAAVIVGVVVVGLIIAVTVLLWYYFTRVRVKKYGGYKPLRDTLKDQRNTMDFTLLIKRAAAIIASDIAAREFLQVVVPREAEKSEAKLGAFVFVKHARLPALRLKKSTRLILRGVRRGGERLHMTQVYDYYRRTVLLSQAPTPQQFTDQWKAIWQEKVGVVVWVGPFVEGDETKMEPYVSLREQGRIRCGEFNLETTMAIRKPGEYDSYIVQAKLGNITRLITFLHIHMWPDSGAPLSPAKLADFVERLQDQQQLKQREHGLPTLLIHCSAGLQRSPTLLAVYIARQMWYLENKVNLLGIFQYIRRRRYKTLGLGNAVAQIQIAFGILQIFAMRREIGKVGALTVEAHERNVFDPLSRQEEIDTSDTTIASFSSPKTSDLEKLCSLKESREICKLLLKMKEAGYKKMSPKAVTSSVPASPVGIVGKETSIGGVAAMLDSKRC